MLICIKIKISISIHILTLYYAINRNHKKVVRSDFSTQMKKLSFGKIVTTSYFFNVICSYLVDLLDYFCGFYFFLSVILIKYSAFSLCANLAITITIMEKYPLK